MPILGGDDGERDEIGANVLNTPLPKDLLERARREDLVALDEHDAPLVAVVESVQEFVDDHDYADGADPASDRLFADLPGEVESVGAGSGGNAFVDWLWFECSEQSLIEARKVTDSELVFVATEEVWAHLAAELDLSTTEATAARDVHNLYAAEQGLAGSLGHSLMAINAPHDRLRRFTSLPYVDDEEFRGARYEAEGA